MIITETTIVSFKIPEDQTELNEFLKQNPTNNGWIRMDPSTQFESYKRTSTIATSKTIEI